MSCWWRHGSIPLFVRRYLDIQWSDRRALAMTLAQSLFIALLISWLFGSVAVPNVDAEARKLAELVAPGVGWIELLPETREEFLKERKKRGSPNSLPNCCFCWASAPVVWL